MNKTFLVAIAALLAAPLALAHTPPGPKDFCESLADMAEHDYLGGVSPLVVGGDGNLSGDCNADGVPADFDGHVEYGLGGGVWFKVQAAADATCDDGATLHGHPVGGPFRVVDVVATSGVAFTATADSVDLTGTDPCGDNVADDEAPCVSSCSVPFAPGLDGYYVLFVEGQAGHAYSP